MHEDLRCESTHLYLSSSPCSRERDLYRHRAPGLSRIGATSQTSCSLAAPPDDICDEQKISESMCYVRKRHRDSPPTPARPVPLPFDLSRNGDPGLVGTCESTFSTISALLDALVRIRWARGHPAAPSSRGGQGARRRPTVRRKHGENDVVMVQDVGLISCSL